MDHQTSIPLKPMRHQSSYENISTATFASDCDHQYDELHGHNRRNRANVATSQSEDKNKPTRRKEREAPNESADSCDVSRQSVHTSKVFRILAFAGFLIALVVFIAVVLLALGAFSPSSCGECKNSVLASGKASASTQELLQVIKELSSNISQLDALVKRKEEIISRLQTTDSKLTDKIVELDQKMRHQADIVSYSRNNLSSLAGPQGPSGVNGPTGPKGEDGLDGETGQRGIGNMTSCQYMIREGTPFKADSSGIGHKVNVTEEPGYKILGVTCSTIGTLEYNFKSEINATTNVREHHCECRGESKVFSQANKDNAKCLIHYWMCPLTF